MVLFYLIDFCYNVHRFLCSSGTVIGFWLFQHFLFVCVFVCTQCPYIGFTVQQLQLPVRTNSNSTFVVFYVMAMPVLSGAPYET